MADLMRHVRDTSQDEYMLRCAEDYIDESMPWLQERCDSEQALVLIAEQGNTPVGYCITSITRPFLSRCEIQEIGLIEHCWVEPAWRRKGIATELVRLTEQWLVARSIQFVDLQYLVGTPEAEKTWQRLGYEPYRVMARKSLPPGTQQQ